MNAVNQIGKRYECTACHTTVLCLRPSRDGFACCGDTMSAMAMEELPSGD